MPVGRFGAIMSCCLRALFVSRCRGSLAEKPVCRLRHSVRWSAQLLSLGHASLDRLLALTFCNGRPERVSDAALVRNTGCFLVDMSSCGADAFRNDSTGRVSRGARCRHYVEPAYVDLHNERQHAGAGTGVAAVCAKRKPGPLKIPGFHGSYG